MSKIKGNIGSLPEYPTNMETPPVHDAPAAPLEGVTHTAGASIRATAEAANAGIELDTSQRRGGETYFRCGAGFFSFFIRVIPWRQASGNYAFELAACDEIGADPFYEITIGLDGKATELFVRDLAHLVFPAMNLRALMNRSGTLNTNSKDRMNNKDRKL